VVVHTQTIGSGAGAARRGVLDLKGTGVAPGRAPSHALHSDGLEYLGVALGDYVIKRVVDAIFERTQNALHTLPVYAVLDLGIKNKNGWNGTATAGVHVRRAHRRLARQHMHAAASEEQRVAVEIEMLLRHYGITSSSLGSAIRITPTAEGARVDFGRDARFEVVGDCCRFFVGAEAADPFFTTRDVDYLAYALLAGRALTIERANVQLTDAAGDRSASYHLYDFGHFNVRRRFEHPLASAVYEGPLGLGMVVYPGDAAFVQPVDALLVDLDVMNRKRLNAACFTLAADFSSDQLSRAELGRRIDELVHTACARWLH
jgi:hypothetical protein